MKNTHVITALLSFLIIFGAYAQSSNVNSSAKKFIYAEYAWEYRGSDDYQKGGFVTSLHISDELEKEIDELKYPLYALDLLGSEGWELVSTDVVYDSYKTITYYHLKKEVR